MVQAHIGHGFLTTALEGGIGYWGRAYDIEREQLTGELAMENFAEYTRMNVVEFEDAWLALETGEFWVDYEVLDAAVREDSRVQPFIHYLSAEQMRNFFKRAIRGDYDDIIGRSRATQWMVAFREDEKYPDLDAEDCDVMAQAVLFGEIRYG